MPFPAARLRRLRRTPALRALVRETTLAPGDLIQPIFVHASASERQPVDSMPGIDRLPLGEVAAEARELAVVGVGAVILFGVIDEADKDEVGSGAYVTDGVVQEAIGRIKDETGERLPVIADTCLCEYTSHGHCGVLEGGEVQNDLSLELIAETALSQARAGADAVAPSDMMDGRVAAIRTHLEQEGYTETPIVSYAVKYASAFYGPFRDAAGSTPQTGDRRGYQMDPANADEALREAALDLEEGADVLMVKPALAYLDVIAAVKRRTGAPLAAYHVSGEYSMLKAAAANGWLDERAAAVEALTSIKRAGADAIVTYYAKEAAKWLS